MLKFYRRIRRNLLTEGKTRTYLAYAIGEILLVVIGILIALAIDNYNDQRLIQAKEQTYLIALKNEFLISKRKLKNLIQVNQQNYEGAKMLVQYTSPGQAPPNEEGLSKLLNNTFAFDISFNPNNSVLNEMINSGSLKDISNPELRKQLTNWISTLTDIKNQEDQLAENRNHILDLVRTQGYSLRTILELSGVPISKAPNKEDRSRRSNLKLLNSLEFENNLLLFMLTTEATTNAHYQPMLQDLNAILALIEVEIE